MNCQYSAVMAQHEGNPQETCNLPLISGLGLTVQRDRQNKLLTAASAHIPYTIKCK